jgi:hypothetical protein
VTGREGPGPERPGPDYPPEWDAEPEDDRSPEEAAEARMPDCTCLPYPYGDGPEEDCPVHGREPAEPSVWGPPAGVPDPWASQGPVPPPPF